MVAATAPAVYSGTRSIEEHARAIVPIGSVFTLRGNGIIPNPALVLVQLGQWGGDNFAQLGNFCNELMTRGFLDNLLQYGVGLGTYLGAFTGPTLPFVLTDAVIQSVLLSVIPTIPGMPAPDGKTIYVLMLANGTTLSGPNGISCVHWCGYHSLVANIPYAVIAPPCPNCAWAVNNSFVSTTVTISHEVAEIATDTPIGTGWVDQFGNEIGDTCNGQGAAYGPWVAQLIASRFGNCTAPAYRPQVLPAPPRQITNVQTLLTPKIRARIHLGGRP